MSASSPNKSIHPIGRPAYGLDRGPAVAAEAGRLDLRSDEPKAGAVELLRVGPKARTVDLRVAEMTGHAEREACVRLQRRVWGQDYRDAVSGSVLKVAQTVGGIAAGAFTADELIGFVFGLTGVREGRVVHWSHMLAVHPAYRNRGVGRRLKLFQRERLQSLGVERMYWTFDPLVARNAHLNLNRLGVVIEDYVTEMYANTGSDLHAFGTDRFVASWPVCGPVEEAPDLFSGDAMVAPIVTGGTAAAETTSSAAVRVEIPVNAESMRNGDLEHLREWRLSTRSAFTMLFELGWRVAGFQRGPERCFYLVTRPDG